MISLTADQLDQIIGGGLRRYGIAPRIVLRTASVEAVRSLVASQLGSPCCRILPTAPGPWSRNGSRPAHQGAHPRHRHRPGGRRGSRLDWTAREFIDIARGSKPAAGPPAPSR